jgi:serine/threonine-protein kinase
MPADSLRPGTLVGAYRIERLLGRGGMGAVFQTYDTRLHRRVALKVLAAGDEGDTSARLLREARSAAALSHPGICTIFEVGEVGDVAFIAMEHVEGPSLRQRLAGGPLSLPEVVQYARQVAEALAHAHDQGVIHRDLKAANIILTAAGGVKIVDFGLARRSDALTASATTALTLMGAGAVAGTPYAMAPEQVVGEATDARTDIWAMGVLLCEMATGRPPFKGATLPELFSAILRDAPDIAAVPPALQPAIGRCLAKEPAARYQRAGDLMTALEAVGAQRSAPRRAALHWSGQRTVAASLAVLVALGLLIGFDAGGVRSRLSDAVIDSTPMTLAVLPFTDAAGNRGGDPFIDGLTQDLITQLGRLDAQQVRVVGRTASISRGGSAASAEQMARELGAGAVLNGSIERSADRVRLDIELRDLGRNRTLWRETYDRGVDELFTLEQDISNALSNAIDVPLVEATEKRLTERREVNPEAFDLYLRGLYHALRTNEQDIDQAISLLEQSAAIDATFVPTQAYLAFAYSNKASTYRPNDPQWGEKAFAAAQKALLLDPSAPEAHYAQAVTLWRPAHGFPSREALAALQRAIAGRPRFDEAWHQRGLILFHVGHLESGFRAIEEAVRLNPSNTAARFRIGPIKIYQQKFEEALAALESVPPEAFPAQWRYQKAWALISLGRLDEAGRLLDEWLAANPVDQGGVLHAARAMVRAKRGDRRGAESDIAEAIKVGQSFLHFHHTAYSIGAVYVVLGDFDRAQEWIVRAANDGFPNYTFFEQDVHLAPLRAAPRFQEFLARLRREWESIPGEGNGP